MTVPQGTAQSPKEFSSKATPPQRTTLKDLPNYSPLTHTKTKHTKTHPLKNNPIKNHPQRTLIVPCLQRGFTLRTIWPTKTYPLKAPSSKELPLTSSSPNNSFTKDLCSKEALSRSPITNKPPWPSFNTCLFADLFLLSIHDGSLSSGLVADRHWAVLH